jgi:hypothetical protein
MPNPDGTYTMAERAAMQDRIFDDLAAKGTPAFGATPGTARFEKLSPRLRDAYVNFGKPGGQQPIGENDR